ncbi:MAG: HVO_2922 family protein [Haloarculaceae archaeon]
MGATFELYEDQAGEYRWRLVHDNGNVIADSGEGYASKQKARQGLQSVKENAPGAPVEDI